MSKNPRNQIFTDLRSKLDAGEELAAGAKSLARLAPELNSIVRWPSRFTERIPQNGHKIVLPVEFDRLIYMAITSHLICHFYKTWPLAFLFSTATAPSC